LNVPEGEDNPGNVNLAEEVYGPFSGQVGFATWHFSSTQLLQSLLAMHSLQLN